MAAKNGLTVVVQELLAKGASVLAVDENGNYKILLFFYPIIVYFWGFTVDQRCPNYGPQTNCSPCIV